MKNKWADGWRCSLVLNTVIVFAPVTKGEKAAGGRTEGSLGVWMTEKQLLPPLKHSLVPPVIAERRRAKVTKSLFLGRPVAVISFPMTEEEPRAVLRLEF